VLPYRDIPGLFSKKALVEHVKLWQSYIDRLAEIDGALRQLSPAGANPVAHPGRMLYGGQSYALGGVELHRLFFGNVSRTPPAVGSDNAAIQAITARWGSTDNWWRQMRTAAMCARGWAVLARCPKGTLRIFSLDSHDLGPAFGHTILCAIDVYEHAYWMDFGAHRDLYLDRLVNALDWNAIASRM
jgi:Fe-Mn family superoxide dismutase